ncbi:ChbG/HpnK family deacetylase [Humibacter ginsenosidimutans]|uniref:ChbG/HpnK family deacetylase n=1 Tax=Humibacter ginsenosidimutans TaxID=2599293 RepID=A0A5B8M5L7_9MICO|nr:ChbG/HpnK family deacetylase [Humibacter ginsenosidimutans]QDZ15907.1 ChbG/HpnK family deacetylase [Humibacter ginsenosidimutans]
MTRTLVITADDFGRDPGTTDTILALLDDGAITATTLIAVADNAERAAEGAIARGTSPHLHGTLTRDRGAVWHPLSGRSSLMDADGLLFDDPAAFDATATTDDAFAELDAQLAWMRARGLDPAAVDSHAGTLYGLNGRSWLADALRWCAANELAFRLPRDARAYFGDALPAPLAHAHARAVAYADRLGVSLPHAILTNHADADELGDYEALRDSLIERLAELPEGASELFLHPSAPGAVPGPAGVAREWEARLLRDDRWHAAIEREGIHLVAAW